MNMAQKGSMTLRIACTLTGDDYDMLKGDTPASRRKVVAMSIAMLIPVTVWFLSGYLLASQVLQKGTAVSLATGGCCALLVFLMEKLVVMSKGGWGMRIFRVLIGFIVAMLGSLALDEVVFREDIDTAVARLKTTHGLEAARSAALDYEALNGYADLERRISEAERQYEAAEDRVIREADGTYGTGKRGAGKITALKDGKARMRRAELDRLLAERNRLDAGKKAFADTARAQAEASFSEHALLVRIKALAQLVESDPWMMLAYVLFTLLLFCIEFIVIILKASWGMTNYERRVEMMDKVGERRMRAMMGDGSPIYDPAYSGRELGEGRRRSAKGVSVFG